MNKNHFLVNTTGILISIFTCGTTILIASPSPSQSISHGCYMVKEDGQLVDLSNFCGQKPPVKPVSPQRQSVDASQATQSGEGNGQSYREDVSGNPDREELPTDSALASPEEIDRSKLPGIEKTIPLIGRQREVQREKVSEE
jgi:hypothetical protein